MFAGIMRILEYRCSSEVYITYKEIAFELETNGTFCSEVEETFSILTPHFKLRWLQHYEVIVEVMPMHACHLAGGEREILWHIYLCYSRQDKKVE